MKKKNAKKVGQTILLQLLYIALLAQSKTSVSGLLKDSAAQKPLQYATVELFRANQLTQPVKSVYTN